MDAGEGVDVIEGGEGRCTGGGGRVTIHNGHTTSDTCTKREGIEEQWEREGEIHMPGGKCTGIEGIGIH